MKTDHEIKLELQKLISMGMEYKSTPSDVANLIFQRFIKASPLKPLSELHKDREACEKIYFLHFNKNPSLISKKADCTVMSNDGDDLFINDSGKITFWGDSTKRPTQFTLVDTIRSLGYDVQPEKSMIKSHNETIKCPECTHIQEAKVLHTAPWYSYNCVCDKCGYLITESEWDVQPETKTI